MDDGDDDKDDIGPVSRCEHCRHVPSAHPILATVDLEICRHSTFWGVVVEQRGLAVLFNVLYCLENPLIVILPAAYLLLPPGLYPWTRLGDFRPSDPSACPTSKTCLHHCIPSLHGVYFISTANRSFWD